MRNLKKILALVLALVMSLSLMATAGAAETTAADSTDPYATAKTVLEGLSVFKGYTDGQMNYNQPITRVQTAALIYRIATGDVADAKVALHTNNPFNDVAASYWGNSYISYGYNAGILKGYNKDTFNPDGNVTGYQTLAMILRAMGYGRNGEFEGTGWEVRTASKAQELGLLKNVTPAEQTTLGQPATRGMVAEILFRALLKPMAMYSALNPYNYTELDSKLADNLGLEEIEGVVMANQWADLENTKVLADGKTRMKADDKNYTLDYATERDDIGESRLAYIQNGTKVLYLADSGKNVVKENEGKKTTVSSLRDELDVTNAEHFVNFSDVEANSSEWLIRYSVTVSITDADGNITYEPWYALNNNSATLTLYGSYLNRALKGDYALFAPGDRNMTRNATVTTRTQAVTGKDGVKQTVMTVSLQPGAVINDYDRAIMQQIFYTADRWAENPGAPVTGVDFYIDGEVYAGTTSLTDKSDIMSWNQFVEEYLVSDEVKVTAVENGNELKIIDNNGDGKAEYVLKTMYTLDKVAREATKDGASVLYYQGLDIEANKPVYLDGYTPAVADVVLYAVIDGTAQMQKAESATAAFKAVSYKDETATDKDGKVWEQSGIYNRTQMPGNLTGVNENASYTLYLDKYGFVRAYDTKTNYALVTEIYPTNTQNQAWVTSKSLTAEVVLGDAEPAEYNLANNWYTNSFNPFYTGNAWTYEGINDGWWLSNVVNNIYGGRPNYLNRARNGLGTTYESNLFNFGTVTAPEYSWTNVAKYTLEGSDITLTTAANYALNGNSTASWTEDYIQLKVKDTNAKDPLYATNDLKYTGKANEYVRAVDDTEIFVVARADRQIKHYTGYSNVPALKVSDNGIRAMYAVAERANADLNDSSYWIANVIVIEIETFGKKVDSVSLIYSNDYKVIGDIKYLQAIDNEKGLIGIIPTNSDWHNWQGQFNGRGFYTLSKTRAVEGQENIYYAEITKVTNGITPRAAVTAADGYNANNIFYGRVCSLNGELSRSNYITVDKLGVKENGDITWNTTYLKLTGGAYGIDGTVANANECVDLISDYHANKQVKEGDEIVWVEGGKAFLVDLTDSDLNAVGREIERDWYPTPSWLYVDTWLSDMTVANAYNRGEAGNVILDQLTSVETVQIGTFYDTKFYKSNDSVTVSFEDALKGWAKNHDAITTTNDYVITDCVKVNPDGTTTKDWPDEPASSVGTWRVTVAKKDGTKVQTIDLILSAPRGNTLKKGDLFSNIADTVDANGFFNVDLTSLAGHMTIDEFIAAVEKNCLTWSGSVYPDSWKFYDGDTLIDPEYYHSYHMNEVSEWYLFLRAEDGELAQYKETGKPAAKRVVVTVKTNDGLERDDAVLTKNDDGSYTLTIDPGDLTDVVIEINGTAYRLQNGKLHTLSKAASDLITVELSKDFIDSLGDVSVIVIVVRAYVKGETVTDAPEKPSEVKEIPVTITSNVEGASYTTVPADIKTVKQGESFKLTVTGAETYAVNVTGGTAKQDETTKEWTITASKTAEKVEVSIDAEAKTTVSLTIESADEKVLTVSPAAAEVEVGKTVEITLTPVDATKEYDYTLNGEKITVTGGKCTYTAVADVTKLVFAATEKGSEEGAYKVTVTDSNKHTTATAKWDATGEKLVSITLTPDANWKAGSVSSVSMGGTTLSSYRYTTDADATTGVVTITFADEGGLAATGDVVVTATSEDWKPITITVLGKNGLVDSSVTASIVDADGKPVTLRKGDAWGGNQIVITADSKYTLDLKVANVKKVSDDSALTGVTRPKDNFVLPAVGNAEDLKIVDAYDTTDKVDVTVNFSDGTTAIDTKAAKIAANGYSIDVATQVSGKRVTKVEATMGTAKLTASYDATKKAIVFSDSTVINDDITVTVTLVADIKWLDLAINNTTGAITEAGGDDLSGSVYEIVDEEPTLAKTMQTQGGAIPKVTVLADLGGLTGSTTAAPNLAALTAEEGSYLLVMTFSASTGNNLEEIGYVVIPKMKLAVTTNVADKNLEAVTAVNVLKGEKLSTIDDIKLVPSAGYTKYPASVEISMATEPVKNFDEAKGDYSYDKTTGVISFSKSTLTMDAAITITPAAASKELPEVAVTAAKEGTKITLTLAPAVDGSTQKAVYIPLNQTITWADFMEDGKAVEWTDLTTVKAIINEMAGRGFTEASSSTAYDGTAGITADSDVKAYLVIVEAKTGDDDSPAITIGYVGAPA